MKTWRLHLVAADGTDVSHARALVRYAACWIGPGLAVALYAVVRGSVAARSAALLLLVNYAWAFVDPERQFLHDRLARTRIVDDTLMREP